MKINFTTGPFYPSPPAPTGAVERLWFDIGRELAAAGHEVSFVSRAWPGFPRSSEVEGMKIERRLALKQTGSIKVDLVKDLAFSLRMTPLLPSADVTVTNSFWFPVLVPLLRRRAGAVVVAIHRWPKGQTRLYRRAAILQCPSNAVAQEVLRQDPAAEGRVRVIPNPINAVVFQPAPRSYQGRQTVLYAGRVHPEKGLHLLVEAFVLAWLERPELRLRIVGPQTVDRGGGGEAYLSRLRQLAGEAPVSFDPPVYDRHELAAVFQAAHLFVYPSMAAQGESFGVAPLEAMATGLVPVVSGLTVFKDFIDDTVGRSFDHESPTAARALAGLILDLLADPGRMKALSEQAVERARQFSTPRVAQQFEELFGEILAGRRS